MKKRILKIIIIVGLFVCTAVFGFAMYGQRQMEKIPGLSFQDALEYTTGDNPDAVITVGIIKDGQVSYRVYGENGQELPAGNAYPTVEDLLTHTSGYKGYYRSMSGRCWQEWNCS